MRAFGKSIFLLLSALVCKAAVAQNFEALLANQRAADPQEKMFVHFDKNYYNPGESIWFKAYLFQGMERSKDSRNFYAELRDEKGNLLDFKTAPVILSGAASSFQLPDSMPRPNVLFRAYTVNMLNSDTSFLYIKSIKILQPVKKQALPVKPVTIAPEIRFLPEGGDLVGELQCRVAFICTGINETPVYCKGIVKDGTGKKLIDFEAVHDGMGNFLITPQAGQTYAAVWKDEKGREYSTPLPAVKTQGIVLGIFDGEGGKTYTIQRTADAPAVLQKLTVVAVQHQQLVYQASINLTAKTAIRTQISTADMLSGIMQVTVFDANQKPVAERICFVNNSNYEFDADAWLPEPNTTKRGLNRGEVKIGDTTTANLSLSITDADLDVPENNHDNIVTRLLLTGDLRGKIYAPWYYFFSTSDSVGLHLDLVMQTHGWRRYNWQNVMEGRAPVPKFKEVDYLSLAGRVIGSQAGVFEPGLSLNGFLKTKDSTSNFVSFPIDRKGNISYPGMIFYDTAKLYLSFSDKNRPFDANMVSLSNGLYEPAQLPGMPASLQRFFPYEPDTAIAVNNAKNNAGLLKANAKRFKDAQLLQNVTVTAKAKSTVEQLEKKYVGSMFQGDGKSFDILNDPSARASFSIFQYLQGRVAGLQISTNGSTPSLSWRGGTPALYLNELQTDANQISTLSMSDVAYIKVLTPGTAGVIANSGSGVIAIYTRKGGDVVNNEESKLGVIKLRGYSQVKQFYSPNYASAENNDSFYDDLRTTLYWNPFILLDKTRKRFKFQFYNNDISSHLRITLEGINEEGKLVHIEKVIGKN